MTYYGGKELAASFRTVRKNTLKVAEDIPEEHYGHVAAAGARSVAQMLAHVAIAPRLFWMAMHESRSTDLTGFDFFSILDRVRREETEPRTKAEVLQLLTSEGDAFAAFLEGLSEADLAATVTSPSGAGPVPKSRFEMIISAKEHEMHHRAQLMLIERQLGIVPHPTRQLDAMIAQASKRAGA